MVATTAWAIDAAFATCGFTLTDFNSLASGNTVVASSAVTNGTALDLYSDVSFAFTVGASTSATSYISVFILPLNQDASTYGDGAVTGATPPVSGYLASNIGVASGVGSGSAVAGTFRGLVVPPSDFKFAIQNNLGVALAAAAAAGVKAKFYGENLNN